MKRSRHYTGGIGARARLRQLQLQENAKDRALRANLTPLQRKRQRIKLARVQAQMRREAVKSATQLEIEREQAIRRSVVASKILRRHEQEDTPEQLPDGLGVQGKRPSKDHFPYLVSLIVKRDSVVSPFSAADHYGVLYPATYEWAVAPEQALRDAGANGRQYRAQLAPEALAIMAQDRAQALREEKARQQPRNTSGQFGRK